MIGCSHAFAGTNVYLGFPVPKTVVSMDDIDHSVWDKLLGKYVSDGMVNYRSWHNSKADRQRLNGYLSHLSTASLARRASHASKLAFWINTYNALTIHGILREYPTTSIRNHTAKLFGYNIWNDLQIYIGGMPHSLEQIEHQILRKMNEPRIHFAIVCASIGCPRLLDQAYTAEEIETQLEDNAREFFLHRRNFRFDVSANRVYLSSILKWFAEDFGVDQATQLRTISKWLPKKHSAIISTGNPSVGYLAYDWNLNELQ